MIIIYIYICVCVCGYKPAKNRDFNRFNHKNGDNYLHITIHYYCDKPFDLENMHHQIMGILTIKNKSQPAIMGRSGFVHQTTNNGAAVIHHHSDISVNPCNINQTELGY